MRKEFKIGIFAIVILVSIYFVITFLKGQDIFNRQDRIFAEFDNVEGLAPAAAVNIKGLKIGIVESIDYNTEKNNILVTLLVSSDYRINTDAIAELYSSDLLGGKSIRINLTETGSYVGNGDTLKTDVAPDMIGSLVSSIGPLAEEIKTLAANLNTTVSSVNNILDEDTQKNLSRAIEDFSRLMTSFNGISQDVRKAMPEIQKIVSNLDTLSLSIAKSGEGIESIVGNTAELTRQLTESDIQTTISELKGLIASLQDKNGSIGKLLYDDSIHDDIDAVLKNVNELITKISENPKKYFKISVF